MEDFLANKKLSANDFERQQATESTPADQLISDEEA